ncbi:toll/interleukin-1 receptor domain-containing protein [Rhodopirellula sp. MGV]|uniref:toll/interleukin-1 receptor domain-containing protein n=1 Tax=Rhodopirellula sp. MGV TaxID=2023130 RepID=UPI000B977220|nr:toll/interleukin-1 receptor domain-containing protein [Rhodopirellula sp. MGV]OYP35628.1 hypothetical protein CGZ80_11165 [Rhodopirellula sp. MGV]PNY34035.1 toll/interleukin-1 receptor domain-containing protein [Rhodopirellula baltica]PNY35644.1 toll/interleukin-1 receptor domain-containing protein [Rhodopirellula baltica]
MSTVFISYSHVDSQIASDISELLDAEGVSHFRDVKDIGWGQDIEGEVRIALHNCAAIIVVVSPASLDSAWVPYEIGHARALKKQILPFLTHPSLKLPNYLSRLSHINTLDGVCQHLRKFEFKRNAAQTSEVLQKTIKAIADTNAERIAGKWIGQGHQQRGPDGHPIDYDLTLELHATNDLVTGTMTLSMPYRGTQYTGLLNVAGGFVGGRFVWINYVGNHGPRPHFGSMVWDLSQDDQRLIGDYTGYGALTDRVVSGFAQLTKVR